MQHGSHEASLSGFERWRCPLILHTLLCLRPLCIIQQIAPIRLQGTHRLPRQKIPHQTLDEHLEERISAYYKHLMHNCDQCWIDWEWKPLTSYCSWGPGKGRVDLRLSRRLRKSETITTQVQRTSAMTDLQRNNMSWIREVGWQSCGVICITESVWTATKFLW